MTNNIELQLCHCEEWSDAAIYRPHRRKIQLNCHSGHPAGIQGKGLYRSFWMPMAQDIQGQPWT